MRYLELRGILLGLDFENAVCLFFDVKFANKLTRVIRNGVSILLMLIWNDFPSHPISRHASRGSDTVATICRHFRRQDIVASGPLGP